MLVRRKHTPWSVLPILLTTLAACSGLSPTPADTPSPLPVSSATSTIAWFPATVTPTPFSTIVILPTQEQRPGLGEVLLTDQFSDASLWTAGGAGSSSIVVERGRILLTARSRSIVLSLRNDLMLTDFYAEITANLSLCRSSDAYGLIVRAAGVADHYRLAVNCSGQVRPERVHNGQMVPLGEWMPSGDAPAGAPGEVRLGIWAAGGELRFFLNGRYQYAVRDPVFLFGSLGVYILPGGTTEATVGFSDLSVMSVSYAGPETTATPALTPRP